jgi:hypothetical protein
MAKCNGIAPEVKLFLTQQKVQKFSGMMTTGAAVGTEQMNDILINVWISSK